MKIFVSYSRSVKTEVGKVIDLLRAINHEVWWDGDIPIMADWWATILDKIEWCDIFIFVVSEKSVQSAYCLAELDYATERNRPILPFVVDDPQKYTIPAQVTPMRAQWYVYNGDPADMINRLKMGMANIQWQKHQDIYAQRPPEPNTNATSIIKLFQDAQKLAYEGKFDEAKMAFRNVKSLDYGEWGVECDEWVERINRYAEIYELAGDKATVKRAITKWNDFKARFGTDFDPFDLVNHPPVLPAPTPPPAPIPTPKPVYTPPPASKPQSVAPNPTPKPTYTPPKPAPTPMPSPSPKPRTGFKLNNRVMVAVVLMVLVGFGAIIINSNNSNTNSNLNIASSNSTNTPRPATATPRPSILPTGTARPANVVARNEDWTPQERDFDGVTMVLVPAGCFMMGSDLGEDDEKPVHEQCFDTPFWIDKYEVTQAQFAQFGGQKANSNGFTGDSRPVERITWFEARDFCALRGGRLPTEREWEYAARGPSNWAYPWGNSFVADNVVYTANSNNQTANVGSRPNGASWVGALDMAGNVWEWTSSLFQDYPYDQNDESVNDNISRRVLRGGSWYYAGYYVRSANRSWSNPADRYDEDGFRCLRSQ